MLFSKLHRATIVPAPRTRWYLVACGCVSMLCATSARLAGFRRSHGPTDHSVVRPVERQRVTSFKPWRGRTTRHYKLSPPSRSGLTLEIYADARRLGQAPVRRGARVVLGAPVRFPSHRFCARIAQPPA
ncbi:hypothetical protein EVAR_798_1 [Eumeta japonica]|uniref:Uncharacterized protein n=1 Tax=Eumeta variegata TaxID=151549 RepID=A0A4C1SC10_EUMVA|nr:hypothetical protein EVAR_798_1 [Eumeta japonica]